jgi:hypothetical protein
VIGIIMSVGVGGPPFSPPEQGDGYARITLLGPILKIFLFIASGIMHFNIVKS